MAAPLRLFAAAVLAGLAMGAAAQDAAPVPAKEPDLYLEAMRAISEGRKDDASRALSTMLAKGPDHASEWLDLAMIQCAIGHAEEAEKLFSEILVRFDPPSGIRDIIAQQRAQGCRRWKPMQQVSVQLGRGYDRNVNQGASNPSYSLGGIGGTTLELLPEFLPQADQYTLGSGDLMLELSESGTVGFAQVLLRRNDTLRAYDTASLFGGLEHPWKLGRWRFRGTALGGLLTLGGRLYQEQAQLQLRVVPPLTLPEGVEVYAVGGVSHVNYKTLTNFDSNIEELRAVASWRGQQNLAQLSVGYQNDHAVGQRPGGDRSGWSAAVIGRRRLSGNWQAEFDLSRQTWTGSTAYAPPLIPDVRKQDTRVARATLVYLLGEHQTVNLEARRVQNKDAISLFEYNNSVLQLSWRWNGF